MTAASAKALFCLPLRERVAAVVCCRTMWSCQAHQAFTLSPYLRPDVRIQITFDVAVGLPSLTPFGICSHPAAPGHAVKAICSLAAFPQVGTQKE